MPGLYTIATRAPGTLVTALIYNHDHQVHVDGRTATLMSGYSDVNATFAPPSGSDSRPIPITLANHSGTLRFNIPALKQLFNHSASWFTPMASPGFPSIGARVIRSTSFSIPNNSATAIDFTGSTAEFNSGTTWVSGSPTRFTASNSGLYYATA